MVLQILQSKATKINFKHQNLADENLKENFAIDYEVLFEENHNDVFVVSFRVNLNHPKEFQLDIEYFTWFKTDTPIDESFKESYIPNENAPAIAFPFLRSFIATITVNAGYKAAILPSINFVALRKKKAELPK